MLRTHWQYSAAGAVNYLSASDYYATTPGELLGKGFEQLDTNGMTPRDVFESPVRSSKGGVVSITRKKTTRALTTEAACSA